MIARSAGASDRNGLQSRILIGGLASASLIMLPGRRLEPTLSLFLTARRYFRNLIYRFPARPCERQAFVHRISLLNRLH
jgi:hypothetical protein